MLGLEGETAEETDVDRIPARIAAIMESRRLNLLGRHAIGFDPETDLVFERRGSLPGHPNGMRFVALAGHDVVEERIYYSVGGGFVATADDEGQAVLVERDTPLPLPFSTGRALLALCDHHGLPISDVMLAQRVRVAAGSRGARRAAADLGGDAAVRPARLRARGTVARAEAGAARRQAVPATAEPAGCRGTDPLTVIDWVNLFALAVNEENAMGGRVVTAPTNGAAGIIPAVLHYYVRFCQGANDDGVIRFLLTAGAIGLLFKANASISGAEVGCQGERPARWPRPG